MSFSGLWKTLAVVCGAFAIFPASHTLAQAPSAPPVDPKLFQELRWRMIGPSRGGRVLPVTGVPGQPETYYFGSVGGGVWKTDDAGRTWNPIFDSPQVASIGAIAVAPSNPQIVYVGSGESDMRSSISGGNGMYKSADAGKTWTFIGLPDSQQIGRILVDPKNPDNVYVAALGHAYGPNSERGVYHSIDGGKNWQRVLFKDENTGAIDLAFEPGNPQVIFAALWQTRRPPWSIYAPSNGPRSGLYRTQDGGQHWDPVTGHGLPSEGLGRIGIAFAPSNPQRVYLNVDAKEGGIYRSDDGGQNWKRVADDRRLWQRGWYFGEITVNPKDPDNVFVPNTSTYQSHDGGVTFQAWKGEPGGDDYHELWIDPVEPTRMILGCDQGALVTRNAGETWSSWYNQPTAQLYHVTTDNGFPYWVYGAQQDSGAVAVPSRSRFHTITSHDWRPIEAGDENGYIAADPLNLGVVYGGNATRQDLSDEQIQLMPPTLAQVGDFRRTWTLPLVYSPTDPHVLYFGSQVLFRTTNGGVSWQAISPDLTREDPGVPPNLDAATAADAPKNKRRGVVYTIAPSFVKAGQIWIGTDDGLIQLSPDEGKTWKSVTPAEITAWSKVTHIEASHFEANEAYAAIDRHRLEDRNPYLYRTHDFGASWQRADRGIPPGSFLNCIREDPVRKGLLYACTEEGVYLSFNDGDDWQSLQLNLPNTSVRDLVVHGDDLVIGTFGRSFWILDDASSLHELEASTSASNTVLFRPTTAFRVRPGYDQATPTPKDEPQSDNPPTGAILDYYLKEKSSTPITLEIFDSAGTLVRRFASDEQLFQTKPETVAFTPDWIADPKPLRADPGTHRFVWNLHTALPPSMRPPSYPQDGAFVPPGTYSVRLTANGETKTQPLVIKMDPRMQVSQSSLQQQFAVASHLNAQNGDVAAAIGQANEMKKQIEARRSTAAGKAGLVESLAQLQREIDAEVQGETEEDFGLPSLPDKELEPLHRVTSSLNRLVTIVESADTAPTEDAITAAAEWQEAATHAVARWQTFLKQNVSRVNEQLQKEHLDPLTPR